MPKILEGRSRWDSLQASLLLLLFLPLITTAFNLSNWNRLLLPRTSTAAQSRFTTMSAEPSKKVMFICLGNICRSPAAEAVFRSVVTKNGKGKMLLPLLLCLLVFLQETHNFKVCIG